MTEDSTGRMSGIHANLKSQQSKQGAFRRPPSVLFYHPLMEKLARSIAGRCGRGGQYVSGARLSYGVELKNIQWKSFPDGFPNIFLENVKHDVAGRDVIFLGTLHSPEVIFEQISVVYCLPRYLARSVTFILPYFPTATMERVDREGAVATASTLAKMLSATPPAARGPCQIVIYDIHCLQERFYFTDSMIPRLESAIPLLLREIRQSKLDKVAIAFPDEGAWKRFSPLFVDQFPLITCIKVRQNGDRLVNIKEGNPNDKHCIIVDDLVMTGGTLIQCAKALKGSGANKISAYVTHAVFPRDSWKRFIEPDSPISTFYITDSIPHATELAAASERFQLLSLCDSISDALLGFDLLQS